MTTKIDIINNAFSRLRISGITKSPSGADIDLALGYLEDLAQELQGKNVVTGYNFEETPDSGSVHNLERKYWGPYADLLAIRLEPDYGKGSKSDARLDKNAKASLSFIMMATAQMNQVQPPPRMPRGSGNTYKTDFSDKFYTDPSAPVLNREIIEMYIDDVNSFTENYTAYLNEGEDISVFTITADDGLTISGETNNTPDIDYTVTADGNGTGEKEVLNLKISITTTDSRISTRFKIFNLYSSDL